MTSDSEELDAMGKVEQIENAIQSLPRSCKRCALGSANSTRPHGTGSSTLTSQPVALIDLRMPRWPSIPPARPNLFEAF